MRWVQNIYNKRPRWGGGYWDECNYFSLTHLRLKGNKKNCLAFLKLKQSTSPPTLLLLLHSLYFGRKYKDILLFYLWLHVYFNLILKFKHEFLTSSSCPEYSVNSWLDKVPPLVHSLEGYTRKNIPSVLNYLSIAFFRSKDSLVEYNTLNAFCSLKFLRNTPYLACGFGKVWKEFHSHAFLSYFDLSGSPEEYFSSSFKNSLESVSEVIVLMSFLRHPIGPFKSRLAASFILGIFLWLYV